MNDTSLFSRYSSLLHLLFHLWIVDMTFCVDLIYCNRVTYCNCVVDYAYNTIRQISLHTKTDWNKSDTEALHASCSCAATLPEFP